MRWLIMSHLIYIYTVCPLDFEFSTSYILDDIFWKFADENFVVCFLVVCLLVVKEFNQTQYEGRKQQQRTVKSCLQQERV